MHSGDTLVVGIWATVEFIKDRLPYDYDLTGARGNGSRGAGSGCSERSLIRSAVICGMCCADQLCEAVVAI